MISRKTIKGKNKKDSQNKIKSITEYNIVKQN